MKKFFLAITVLLLFNPSLFAAAKKSGPEKIVAQAQAKEKGGDYQGAQILYESVLQRQPDYAPALLGLGQVQYWQGDYAGAVKTYEKLLGYDPGHIEALVGIGKAYLAMGKSKKAQEYFDRAKKKEPKNEEVETVEPLLGGQTWIRMLGGFMGEAYSYDADGIGEFQEISITKEKKFGVGLFNSYQVRFGRSAFDNKIFGHWYFLENTRADLSVSFSPVAIIVPKQSYRLGLAQTVSKFTPEIHYTFQDFAQANTNALELALYFDLTEWLRAGGGYEFQNLKFATTTQNFHAGFAKLEFTPAQWLLLHASYANRGSGFEAGRNPTPFVNYRAHVAGGGIRFEFLSAYSVGFEAFWENRDNNESKSSYRFTAGYVF